MPFPRHLSLDLRVPGAFVEIDAARAARGVAALPHRVLLIGQRAAASAVAPSWRR